MRNDLSPLQTALELKRQGLVPVPLHPVGATIRSREGSVKSTSGKEPIGKGWGREALVRDEAGLHRFYLRNPRAGVGILLGPEAGVIALDLDGPRALDSLSTLCGGEEVITLGWTSRRGGQKLFRWDGRLEVAKSGVLHLAELPDLEIRLGHVGRQLQSACPPSKNEPDVPGGPPGPSRVWNGCDIVARLPEAAISYLTSALVGCDDREVDVAFGGFSRSMNDGLDSAGLWFHRALRNEALKVAAAQEGGRHNALLRAARTLAGHIHHGYLPEDRVRTELTQAARRSGLGDAEIQSAIVDAIANGKANPLPWPSNLARSSNNGQAAGRGCSKVAGPKTIADDDAPLELRAPPSPPDEAVYHGLAGRIVRRIEPETEADPLGLLVQLLVMFGNLAGRGAHFMVESTYHYLNEFVVLVGDSATARKGTSYDRALEPFKTVDVGWASTCITSGLSSGEGLIHAVRDPVYKKEPIRKKGVIVDYQDVLADSGVEDKRRLVVETEFGRTLSVQGREGNTLSSVVRQAWDGKDLTVMTKNGYRATGPHVSIIGHITRADLCELLTRSDALNGFANRFFWFWVHASKLLPHGGEHVDLSSEMAALSTAVDVAKVTGRLLMTPSARTIWESAYARLAVVPPGSLGSILNRAAPHVLRLAGIYALLDQSAEIADEHLNAALAMWDASTQCAVYIFGDALGNRDAEKILSALQAAGPTGLTRSNLHERVFQKNVLAGRIKAALELLIRARLVTETVEETGGRNAARYHATNFTKVTR